VVEQRFSAAFGVAEETALAAEATSITSGAKAHIVFRRSNAGLKACAAKGVIQRAMWLDIQVQIQVSDADSIR
jgi:hypothetical protein